MKTELRTIEFVEALRMLRNQATAENSRPVIEVSYNSGNFTVECPRSTTIDLLKQITLARGEHSVCISSDAEAEFWSDLSHRINVRNTKGELVKLTFKLEKFAFLS